MKQKKDYFGSLTSARKTFVVELFEEVCVLAKVETDAELVKRLNLAQFGRHRADATSLGMPVPAYPSEHYTKDKMSKWRNGHNALTTNDLLKLEADVAYLLGVCRT